MITYGGVDIRDIPLADYNKNIAYDSQDNYLFDETVMENIRMGNPNASDEEVIRAAKACGCHDFIMNLEKGYDTKTGGAGGHLSGGERQRISICMVSLSLLWSSICLSDHDAMSRFFGLGQKRKYIGIFCGNDDRIYGNLPGLEFIRTGTLGRGADKCDFCLRIKK